MRHSPREKTRILLVDDNPAFLKLLDSLFKEQGWVVTVASSVAEAKTALERKKWAIDLVLSDISMPGETGFDLLAWIKREDSPNRDLPVLLTTAHLPEAENRVKGLTMGAVDYVVRPIELSELVVRTVHAVDNYKRVRALETSLQDSENLAIVGRLLAASHHEIKNIAALVNLTAEQTVKCFSSVADERGATALRSLSQSVDLLTDVSRNVAGLLQPGAAAVRPVDLSALANEVVEIMRTRVKPCRVEVVGAAGPCWGLANAVRVKQVLINLILNANDAIQELESEAGGSIQVSVARTDETCVLRVVDNGMGFKPAGMRSEFKAFATTKKLRGGQGLGLWLCATLVQNMGGKLTLQSQGIGEGAQAALTLKATEAPVGDEFNIDQYLEEIEDE